MNAVAEHLLPDALDQIDLFIAESPTLTLAHRPQAVTVAAAIFTVAGGTQRVLLNGIFRPAQFAALSRELAEFNQNTRIGWSRLAAAAAALLREEASELRAQADERMLQAEALDAAVARRC